MIPNRFLSLAFLALCGAPLVASQARLEYSICTAHASIAEMPNNPFVADLVEDAWRNSPDGSKIAIESKDSDAIMISGSRNPQVVGIVARDSAGRVFYRRLTMFFSLDANGNRIPGGESEGWYGLICDPVTKTVTRQSCPRLSSRPDRAVAGYTQNAALGATCEMSVGSAQVPDTPTPSTTASWAAWHNQVRGRENLGLEMFDGVPGFRYRLTLTRREHSLHEIVISDELFADLAQSNWLQFPISEFEMKLANIRRYEPDPKLFETSEWTKEQALGGSKAPSH
ncbi:MAG TPA: hypothetical protein VFD98_07095 [Terracidiphilus sp.]|jgi:hypothetical protein|nr:hypothetical protein [Terracidiphilus sp.]